MGSPPQRPSDNVCRLNAPLRQPHGDAANFLHRPADHRFGFACVTVVADFFRTRCWRGDGSSPAWPRPASPARRGGASRARTWFRCGPAPARSWPLQSPLRPPSDGLRPQPASQAPCWLGTRSRSTPCRRRRGCIPQATSISSTIRRLNGNENTTRSHS